MAIVASCSVQLGRLATRCCASSRREARRSITSAQRRAQRKNTKQDNNPKPPPPPLTKHSHIDKAPHMQQATQSATSSSNTSFFSLLETHPLPFAGIFASVTFMIVYFTRGSSRPPITSVTQHVPPDDAPASAYKTEEEPEEVDQPTVGVQDEVPSEADTPGSPPVDLISACGFRPHPDL